MAATALAYGAAEWARILQAADRTVVARLLGQMLSVDHKRYDKLIEENFSFIEHNGESI